MTAYKHDSIATEPGESRPVSYVYTPLNTRGHHIRLFKIWWSTERACVEADVQQFNLRDSPPFHAISYTWGKPPATESIVINGKVLKIRKNLYDFFKIFTMKHTRKRKQYGGKEVWLWADQVCVNQGFQNERNHQVQMMGQIFSQAEEVLIWLGEKKSGGEALRAIGELGQADERLKALMPTDVWANHQAGMREFADNPYWERLWILQEIVLARKLVLFSSISHLDGAKFEAFCSRAMTWNNILHNCTLFHLVAKERHKKVQVWKAQSWLLDACYATLFSKCEDPRDKIYGLQGLLAADQRATIDYTQPTEKVLLDAALMICSVSEEYMVYELGWYIIQIAYGMDLFDCDAANAFFVYMSKALGEERTRNEQIKLLVRLLKETFDGKRRKLAIAGGGLSEKTGSLASLWVV